jgi:hypothetical protein
MIPPEIRFSLSNGKMMDDDFNKTYFSKLLLHNQHQKEKNNNDKQITARKMQTGPFLLK